MDFGSVSYDIFGSPYQKTGSFLADDSLDFGYLGKPYNADTELYDYGFRDYSPEIARFTRVDPIRDGRNWYSYVVNDPVNYVDLWGLQCKSESDKTDDAIQPTLENAFNFDFGQDYSAMAIENYKNGHPVIGTIQLLDSACEIVYDLLAVYIGAQYFGAFIEGCSTMVSTGSVTSGIETIKNYGPINKGPLPDAIANSFRGGSYSQITLQADLELYRVYGGKAEQLGSYWTRIPPAGPVQSKIDLALKPEWGNTAENVVKIKVPAGTTIFEGFVEGQGGGLLGGGSQVIVPNVDPSWVVK